MTTIHLVCKNSTPPHSTPIDKEGIRHRTNVVNSESHPATAPPSDSTVTSEHWQNYQSQMQQYYAHYIQYMQYCQSSQQWSTATAAAHSSQVQPQHQQQLAGPFNPMAAAAAAAAAAVGGHQQQLGAAVNPAAETAAAADQQQAAVDGAVVAGDNLGAPNAGNVMMNAGAGAVGAMEEDDEDMEGGRRDIFDWFYVLSRVLVLISVVYSYSSLARFALIAGVAVIVYVYKLGFLGNQRPQDEAAAANLRPRQGAAAAAHQQGEAAHPRQDEQPLVQDGQQANAEEQAVTPPPPPQEAIELQPAWYDLVVTFVTTFFTSMVPDNNDPQVF